MREQGITFTAIFSKATTTVDGGWRISFEVSQNEASKIHELSALRERLLQIAVVPIGMASENDPEKEDKFKFEKGKKISSADK